MLYCAKNNKGQCTTFRLASAAVSLLVALLLGGCRPIEAGRGELPDAGAQAIGAQAGQHAGAGQNGPREETQGKAGDEAARPAQARAAPPVTWDDTPPCQNSPQDAAAWAAAYASATDGEEAADLASLLEQMHRYTQQLPAYTVESAASLLAADPADPQTAQQQALTVLWLNLIDERLNRATAIAGGGTDTPQSVGELADQLAAEAASPQLADLLALAESVNAGQQLGTQVCAQIIYRAGAELRTAQWTEGGAITVTQPLSAPNGFTTFSPDYTRLVVQTPRGDTAGGPLYLYHIATGATTNLNEQSNLPSYTSVSALKVVGWHPNNDYLLLANEDDEVTIWLDLAEGTYTPLALGIDTSQMAAPRSFTLAPDGSGFTFLTHDRGTEAGNIFWYDVAEGAAHLLFTHPAAEGNLEGVQISPDGQQAVYVLHKGSRRAGRSEELRLVDLAGGETRCSSPAHWGRCRPPGRRTASRSLLCAAT